VLAPSAVTELFLTGYDIGSDALRALAEPVEGKSMASVSAIAKDNSIAILLPCKGFLQCRLAIFLDFLWLTHRPSCVTQTLSQLTVPLQLEIPSSGATIRRRCLTAEAH